MPKKTAKNAYYYYMMDFKAQQKKKGINYGSLADVANAASSSWRDLPTSERARYENIAQVEKGNQAKKYTSYGESLYDVNKRIQNAKNAEIQEEKDIEKLVSTELVPLEDKTFYIMDVNYYCKTSKQYVICEFALTRFSLREGCLHNFHQVVNPGSIPPGYAFDAKVSCEEFGMTLPDPNQPVSNYFDIMASLVEFLKLDMKNKEVDTILPPIFAKPTSIGPVHDFIKQLCEKTGEREDIFRVYKIELFYHHLCMAIAKKVPNFEVPSVSLSRLRLKKDSFQYTPGLACDDHERGERALKCCLSRCMRLMYTILDMACPALDIELKAVSHLPGALDIGGVLEGSESEYSSNFDERSFTRSRPYGVQPGANLRSDFSGSSTGAIPKTPRDVKPDYQRNFPSNRSMGRGTDAKIHDDFSHLRIGDKK